MNQPASVLTQNLNQLANGAALGRQLAQAFPDGITPQVTLGLNNQGKPQLMVQGNQVYHPDEPVLAAAREIESFWATQNPDLVVFFGLGLGLHSSLLQRKTEVPILVFEPSLEVLARVLAEVPLELEGITLITNLGHLIQAAGEVITASHKKMAVGAVPSYRGLFPQPFEDFRTALGQVMRKLEIDQGTKAFFSDKWVSHLAANLPRLVQTRSLEVLGNHFRNKPGILVGAGPSLDDNIEVLAKARDKALICAVHTAVMPLAAAGITPDLVVIIEGHKLDYFFEEVGQLDEMVLIPGPQTHPVHLDLGFKDMLTISTEGHASADWFNQAYGLHPLSSGGSVACTAFSLLHQLGCEPIILVGMDAAFTQGRTHSLAAQEGCCRVRYDAEKDSIAYTYLDGRSEDGFWNSQHVTAWGGQDQVLTRPVYSSFRHWFESASQTWAGSNTLINATEGGARFDGFTEITLAQAIDDHCQHDVPASQLIADAISAGEPLDPAKLGHAIRGELDIILHAATAAQQAEKTAQKALKLLRSSQLSALQPVLDKLGLQEKTLQELTRKTRLLNTMVGHRASTISTDEAKKPAANDKVGLTIASVEKSREISRMVSDGAAELEKLFGPVASKMMS